MSTSALCLSLAIVWIQVAIVRSDVAKDVTTLSNHLKDLEEVEQREALVLANVLSNLKQTTDELEAIKHNYTQVQNQLITTYKNRMASLESEMAAQTEEVANLTKSKGDLSRKYKQLEKKLENLEARFTGQETKLDSCEHSLTSLQADLQVLEQSSKDTSSNLNATSSALMSNMNAMKSDIRVIQENMRPLNGIGFEAIVNHTTDLDASVTSLIFSNVLFNQGNAFNASTGYFTADVPGTYIFWISCTFFKLSSLHIQIMKNDEVIGSSYGSLQESSQRGVSRGMTVASLDKGDTVHFSPEGIPHHLRGGKVYAYSTYGGALLYRSRS